MLGGVVVHEPDERMTARTAALVLQARNVSLADVFEARGLIEPTAVRVAAGQITGAGPLRVIQDRDYVVRSDTPDTGLGVGRVVSWHSGRADEVDWFAQASAGDDGAEVVFTAPETCEVIIGVQNVGMTFVTASVRVGIVDW